MRDPLPRVVLVTFDAGGGHRAAANALVAAAEQRAAPFRFEVISLQDVLAPLDPVRRLTGGTSEQLYNELVRRRRTRFLVPMLRGLQWAIRRAGPRLARQVANALASRAPAAVLSVIPNFNAVIAQGVRLSHPQTPFLVALTDFADFPPHFWFEPALDGVIVASEHAAQQALALGLPAASIHRTSGMPLHPRFYPRADPARRQALRAEWGLRAEDFTVLLTFGGKGSPEMEPLCARLLRMPRPWRVIAICGDNPPLYQRLRPLETVSAGRLRRVGFTDRMADFMAAADVLLTKPGPGSLAEAFHQGVPPVVVEDARTIPQERYNVRMVEREGLGVAVKDWRHMASAVAELADDPARLSEIRQRLERLPDNRAVYETLEVLGRVVSRRLGQGAA
jgi:1,2-diacylglycerol 3-beta-galactosyltransferase